MPTETAIRLTFDPAWSWLAIALVTLALVAIVWWSYRPKIAHLTPWRRRLLLGFRFSLIAILLLMLLRPELRYTENDDSDATILILADQSRSMTVPDMPGGLTRRAALAKLLADNAGQLAAFDEKLQVRFMEFAENLEDGDTSLTEINPAAEGTQTAIGHSLEQVMGLPEFDRTAAVVVLSDGAERTTEPTDARAIAARFGEGGIPIYTVPLGGDGALDAFDLAVEEILVDPLVYERKTVPIAARVRVTGGAGLDFIVRLTMEDRTGLKVGESGPMKPIPAASGVETVAPVRAGSANEVLSVDLSFIPPQAGEFKIGVEIEPADGEVKLTNNQRQTIINVRKGGLRVALFASPLTEQKFLRNVNTDQKIQLDFQPVFAGVGRQAAELPDDWFEEGKYDAYLFADVPAGIFSDNQLQLLAKRIDEGAGLLMMGGARSFEGGGWGNTPIARYLPVDVGPGGGDGNGPHIDRPLPMLPTRAGLTRYVMQLGSANQEKWQALPPLEGANRLRPRAGGLVEILAASPEGDPLLVAHTVGQARLMAFAGDTTYLWYLAGHDAEHQRFWRQIILWLTRKDEETDQAVWVIAEPRNLSPGQSVGLTYGAQDATGNPVLDARFELNIVPPEGEDIPIPAATGAARNEARFESTTAPGDYWVRVAAQQAGNSLGLDGWTRFLVEDRDFELDNPAADPGLLYDLAELSGGQVVPNEEFQNLLQTWLSDPPGQQQLMIYRRTPLWDNVYLLSLFVALIATEWFCRKRFGLV